MELSNDVHGARFAVGRHVRLGQLDLGGGAKRDNGHVILVAQHLIKDEQG